MQHRIVIGDWSKDGHNQSETFTFECSHDAQTIKKAYKDAVKKCKVSLHDSVAGKELSGVTPVCCRYGDAVIKEPEVKALQELGVDFSFSENGIEENYGVGCQPLDVAYLFFEMARTQIPDFKYQKARDKQKTINGFWSSDFNHSFGYGCFE